MSNKRTDRSAANAVVSGPLPKLMIEFYVWLAIALLVSGQFWLDLVLPGARVKLSEVVGNNYYSILGGAVTFLFPYVFRLIFDALPLQYIGRRWAERGERKKYPSLPGFPELEWIKVERRIPVVEPSQQDTVPETPEILLARLARESGVLSERIYTRAGVYLLFGVFIALTGVMFFYVQASGVPKTVPMGELMATLAPRFGVLFFIELVAFFFLRQYRSAMDEFRHFEAIKRNREENLALILLTTKEWKGVDIYKAIGACAFNSTVGYLKSGDTTEVLEARKLSKDELALFEKIVDVFARPKS